MVVVARTFEITFMICDASVGGNKLLKTIKMQVGERYLRFWTADLHDLGFWSDHKPPAPLGLILTFLEFLLKR